MSTWIYQPSRNQWIHQHLHVILSRDMTGVHWQERHQVLCVGHWVLGIYPKWISNATFWTQMVPVVTLQRTFSPLWMDGWNSFLLAPGLFSEFFTVSFSSGYMLDFQFVPIQFNKKTYEKPQFWIFPPTIHDVVQPCLVVANWFSVLGQS